VVGLETGDDALLRNVPYLLPSGALTVRPAEVLIPCSGGRRREVEVGSFSNASSEVTVVYVTTGLIKAKNNGTRRRMRKMGKMK
jgi:hypothetical protein